MRRIAALSIAAAALLGLGPLRAAAEGWGDVKGRVVWANGPVPVRAPLDVKGQDKNTCLKNGPVLSDKYVVNPKNKGVRWVVVWLVDPEKYTKNLPINPDLKKPKQEAVTIDQPCCAFEPHVVALREGQKLILKNSSGIAHNAKMDGGVLGPNINPLIAAGGQYVVKDIKARSAAIPLACGIHPWMNGWVRVFKNPYFAVTDADGNFEIKGAPAGEWRLVVWHEEGWVGGRSPKAAPKITVAAGKTTDVGDIELK